MLLKIKQAAQELGLAVNTIYAMIQRGELRAVRYGKRALRIDENEIQLWIRKHTI